MNLLLSILKAAFMVELLPNPACAAKKETLAKWRAV